jgi:uncharacterized protein (DUF433 family)
MAAQEIYPGIVVDPAVMGGKPVIKGTRITVEQVIAFDATGATEEDWREGFHLTKEQVNAALSYGQVITGRKDAQPRDQQSD